ncbi:sortase [Candidatus Nomurabacteria bacterium]|nr:sortase [Candidatus Nomurabacteria bacterium]
MQPNDPRNIRPTRGQTVPPARRHNSDQSSAVANMTREQINAIYSQQQTPSGTQPTQTSHTEPQWQEASSEPTSVYDRTESVSRQTNSDSWKQYHTAWQDYYQKYYERYYMGAVRQTQNAYQKHAEQLQKSASESIAAAKSQQNTTTKVETEPATQTMSEDEALYDLRQQIIGKVQDQAKKVRKSRHFMPAISALVVFVVFAFLQYNSMIIGYAKAYVTPGSVKSQDIIVNPNVTTAVDKAPRLIIPKININVGVDYNTKPTNDTKVKGNLIDAMRKNVAYFGGFPGALSKPGQLGNFGLSGHSSNEWYTSGAEELKFVFVRLPDLRKGDVFYLNYNGTRYTYSIVKTVTVKPTDTAKLNMGYDKPYATLITCVPIGTDNERLFIVGEQISPSPETAKHPATGESSSQSAPQLTGKDPTVLERLFGR